MVTWIIHGTFLAGSPGGLNLNLQGLIASKIESVDVIGNAPVDLAKCAVINKVARKSIAASAGVQPGDLLASIRGSPGATFRTHRLRDPNESVEYVFYRPSTRSTIHLIAKGWPIGIDYQPTPEAILRKTKVKMLDAIWDRGDWALLEKASRQAANMGCLIGTLRFVFGRHKDDTPATLMLGAALYEQGHIDEGMALIERFQAFEESWTTQYQAIVRYYFALQAERFGDRTKAISLLHHAYQLYSSGRIAKQIEGLSGERVEAEPRVKWHRKTFPIDYELDDIKASRRVALREHLSLVTANQLLVLCVLGQYRANGPYTNFIRAFRQWKVHFPTAIACLHVLTMRRTPISAEKYWMDEESDAIEEGLPVFVLHDTNNVCVTLQPVGSPYVLFLTRDGIVHRDGWPDGVQFWEMLEDV